MLATLDVTLNDTGFKTALALIGAGAGLLASQLGNVIMSSVPPAKTSEGGGLQGTAQNLGSSLGTAIIGAVLLASLATGFSRAHRRATRTSRRPRARRSSRRPKRGSTSCPVEDVEQAAVEGGLTQDQAARRRRRTTATRSSRRCGWRSAPSRSPRCCRCGSRGDCRPSRSPRTRAAPGAGGCGRPGVVPSSRRRARRLTAVLACYAWRT